MPSSPYQHISKIMDLVVNVNPCSILDVGAGFGKYGVLCREYLELWDGRQIYSEFLRRIDAVEVFEKYVTPLYKFIYDNTFTQDIVNLSDELEVSYDLILLVDVIEHLDKERGRRLLLKLLANNKGILISTPKNPSNQKDAFNNIFETHKSRWTKKELYDLEKTAKRASLYIHDRTHLILYLAAEQDANRLRRKLMVLKTVQMIPALGHVLPYALRILKKIRLI